jgi:hypothetical protein
MLVSKKLSRLHAGPNSAIVQRSAAALAERIPVSPEVVALAQSAATTIVRLLATDTWKQTKVAVAQFWQRVHPKRATDIEEEIAETRADLLAARETGDEHAEQDLVTAWQVRLRQLLTRNPEAAAVLADLLEHVLDPALAAARQSGPGVVTMQAHASGNAQVFQAGRNQHLS